MAKTKQQKKTEADSTYFLKILLFLIVGSVWVHVSFTGFPLPIGFVLGLLFASHDHFQIDRKVEYAVLLVAAIISLVIPSGVVLNIQ